MTEALFQGLAREVYAGHGTARSMGYRYRARVDACTSFGRPRFRAIGEYRFVSWRDEGWKGPKRETREEAAADANRWLDAREASPRDWSEGYV